MKSERPPTDQRASQRHQGFVYLWPPLISDPQATKLMQPRDSSLNYPSKYSQPATVLGVAFSQHRLNPFLAHLLTVRLRIIGAVSLHALRAPSRSRPSGLRPGRRVAPALLASLRSPPVLSLTLGSLISARGLNRSRARKGGGY